MICCDSVMRLAREEAEVRAMRDKVYERPSSDKNWDGCREHWMQPANVQWLREQCARIDAAAERFEATR